MLLSYSGHSALATDLSCSHIHSIWYCAVLVCAWMTRSSNINKLQEQVCFLFFSLHGTLPGITLELPREKTIHCFHLTWIQIRDWDFSKVGKQFPDATRNRIYKVLPLSSCFPPLLHLLSPLPRNCYTP